MTIPVFRSKSLLAMAGWFPVQWPTLKKGVIEKTRTTIDYYRRANRAVANTNILIRFIQSSQVPLKLPLSVYYKNVEQLALSTAGSIGMTTISEYGLPNFGFFYGSDNQEEFIAYKSVTSPDVIHAGWQQYQTVKPLIIAQSDLGISYPIGKKYSVETGITCIAVDVVALMVQYRAWFLANELKPAPQRQSIQHFIATCVIPNMMVDQPDLLFMNRIYNAWYGLRNGDSGVYEPHPFATANYTAQVDSVIPKIIDNIRKLPVKSIPIILRNIPSFSKENMGEFLVLPSIMNVTQNDWALVASRLKYYALLCDMCGDSAKQNNADEFTGFIRHMRLYDAQQYMAKHLSSNHAAEAKRLLEVVYKYTGRP